MRKIDKKLNIMKANLLAESRYLENKGLIKEESDNWSSRSMKRKQDLGDPYGELGISGPQNTLDDLKAKAKDIVDRKLSYNNEVELINKSVSTEEDKAELINQISIYKRANNLKEMDYSRDIVNDDLDFLNEPEFNGWDSEAISDNKFKIKNSKYPNFEFIVGLDNGVHSNAGEYPWSYEAKHIGGINLPTSGHQGVYTIEKSATKDLRHSLLKFINSKETLMK